MTTLEKVLFAVLGVVLVAFGIFVAVKEHQVSTMQTTINSSLVAQKTLLDNITLSSSQYVSKSDLDAFAAQEGANLSVIQQSLNTLNAQIVAINAAQTTIKATKPELDFLEGSLAGLAAPPKKIFFILS